ncbi:Fatty acid oxidation complex subunit alpha (Includes: Enoyl-CoA hydratase/Delta(3)-cis-Delta(2)-trans-enoyl-CoA isomerase/3-hydroxybutyryl-CoA epimerase; 3-hydroxyacyl-CoA dehydrogenase) [Vibrio coralliirubri]|uniref:fatty acid oxidation complex subunit alpha FadB n=1 Tax=Vibrio coralliirubri TaxID=1516159 RepID=UPI0006312A08|nr:fatty acid oxidation complex subunit alpha FadB [Vibrio coralliirubri]CDT30364.1 Fatty acid oxidation complex subunit alpha (Includes: Enoyl-CoA hydratase/Delta(3)-cis-Delta(2)-trans-enoyl-CoA isomerase/3-hydroxybutyryl-CoA epimerase; 3-hydroxyacyl-CoA dehydrogenase) [Vibrio coralliirubri]
MFTGQFFKLAFIEDSNRIVELVFNAESDSVNTLTKSALIELESCVEQLENSDAAGLIIRSGKALFSAGADVKAFRSLFSDGDAAITDYLSWAHSIYNRIEDLNLPKVAIVNGVAAGGGVELSLLADYRLATTDLKMSLPEVKLGIMPAWGGVTRLPRITGVDTALQWLTTGKTFKAQQALEHHVVDGVIDASKTNPIESALTMLESCISGDFDWQQRYAEKQAPLTLNDAELAMSINVAKGMVAKAAGPHYPAPGIILNTISQSARCSRDEALKLEQAGIIKCVASGVADALVNVFLSDMAVKATAKKHAKGGKKTEEVGVVGAGIMGGGIAYVTADKKLDVVLKDINKQGLALGLNEANQLLSKQVTRGRKSPEAMGEVLNRIVPTLHNAALDSCDLVIEAVVENPIVKEKVLAELEQVAPNAMIASNTSTLMISGLAHSLKNPENFCGIHFFNPVHRMPLVEVIKGEQTSAETVATAVNYVLALGKTPIVVNDCAGFLVNRCLTPYFLAFNQLLVAGGDIAQIDKVMSKGFGWPMGPAHLLDVIGLDTADHCIDVMSEAFPTRLAKPEANLIAESVAKGRLGQKTKEGFYLYKADRKGRLQPENHLETTALIDSLCDAPISMEPQDITLRMMLPMMYEAIRCLDDGIISSAAEGDIAFIYGTGFPAFRGGIFYYMDSMGLDKLLEIAQQYEDLGSLYAIPQGLRDRVELNRNFYA